MCLILCPICDEQLSLSPDKHACDDEKTLARIKRLQEEAGTANRRLDDMQDAVRLLLKELSSLDGQKIEVSGEWLRKLWDATENRWYEHETADEFLVMWMVTHRVLCEASDVFRSNARNYMVGRPKTKLEKLTDLFEACASAQKVLGYDKDVRSKLDTTPEKFLA